jgi:acyl-CoA reductase-like NAD-dependent aldehyde dehydrogenase
MPAFCELISQFEAHFPGMVASDPRLAFGGVNYSGHGRELGVHRIRESTNTKTVWIQIASPS